MSFSHFFSLFYKNIIILKRTFILTSIEVISPILVMFFFYIFKSLFKTENLYIESDEDFLYSNGTFIRNMDDEYFLYENDWFIFNSCFDKYIALIGEDFPEEIVEKLKGGVYYKYFMENLFFLYFNNTKEFLSFLDKNETLKNKDICFGISYSKIILNSQENKIKYKFKLHYHASPYSSDSFIPSTNIDNLDLFRSQPDFDSYKKYIQNGFLNIHKMLYDFILQKETNNSEAEIKYRLSPQKYEKYFYNILEDYYLNILFGIFVLVAYAFPLSINIYRLIKEKESRAKEIMKMMGLNELDYFFSYFVLYFIINIIYSICNTFIISASFDYLQTKYLFLFFFLYGLVIYSLIYFFQSFLEKTAISIILSLLIYSIEFFLFLIFQENALNILFVLYFLLLRCN